MSYQLSQSMMKQAQAFLDKNRLAEAQDIYQKICAQDKNNDVAWMSLGNLHGKLGNIAEAEKCCRKAIELNPGLVSAHANLGNALMAQNRFEEAIISFTKATQIQPDLAAAWYMLGKSQQKLFKWSDAQVAFQKAVQLNPGWLDARLLLGNALQNIGRFQNAIKQYELIIQNQADHAGAHYHLAVSLSSMGLNDKAEKSFRRTLQLDPNHIPTLNNLSVILSSIGRENEALKYCDQVLAIKPNDINAACIASHTYEVMGDTHKAYEYLQRHIEAGTQQLNLAVAFAAVSKELGLQDQAISMMENLLDHATGLTNTGLRNLYFGLGKLLDDMQQYDRAFEHYRKGNELWLTQCNPQNIAASIDASIHVQSADFFSNTPRSSSKSDRPVFIVGMPRSGTSLVEQILDSHPQIYGAGELAEIDKLTLQLPALLNTNTLYPEALKSINPKILEQCSKQYLGYLNKLNSDSLRVIDKMPGNFFHLGFIQLLFPNARVIHCMRNPLDTCLSCYFQDFFQGMDWCYDQNNLAAYYHGYEKLMKHWKQVLSIPIMDVSYENLIDDQQGVSRKLIEFCGLDWSDKCLQFHKTKRYVSTASYDQVRKPIYKKSVARWKNYAAHIEPLKNALKR